MIPVTKIGYIPKLPQARSARELNGAQGAINSGNAWVKYLLHSIGYICLERYKWLSAVENRNNSGPLNRPWSKEFQRCAPKSGCNPSSSSRNATCTSRGCSTDWTVIHRLLHKETFLIENLGYTSALAYTIYYGPSFGSDISAVLFSDI